jgi:hypothetical protein
MPSERADDHPDPLAHFGHMLVCALAAAVITGVLYLTAASTVAAYRAVHGEAGEPGTVTVEGYVSGSASGSSHCEGTFAPDDGGPEVRVFVEIGWQCTEGHTEDARLAESVVPILGKYSMPTAWGEDSKEWIARTVVLVIISLFAAPLALLFGLGTIVLCYAFLRDLTRLTFTFLRK